MAFQRNGTWYSDFTAPNPTGAGRRRYRLSLGTNVRNQREADAAERALLAEIERRAAPNPAPRLEPAAPTGLPPAAFSGFARLWLDTYARVHLKPSTVLRHEKTIRVWLVPYFGDRQLAEISHLDVQRFVAHCAGGEGKKTGRKLAPKTVNEHLSCLSTMLSRAVVWGYLRRSPCEGVDRLGQAPEEWDFYTSEETEVWLAACREVAPGWYAFFLTGFRTGLRLGELFALEWGDLDFHRSKIHVRRSISDGQVTLPKSGKRRIVDMSPHLAETLQAHRHLRGKLVFCAEDGERLNRDNIKHPWLRITRRAGLRQLRHHDMRHSFASQLVAKGVPILAVQQLLGHASLTMTMRYAHLAPGASQQFVSLLDSSERKGAVTNADPLTTNATPLRHRCGTVGKAR